MALENTARIVQGKLLEIVVQKGYGRVADVDEMIEKIQRACAPVAELSGIVVAADWRACTVFAPEVADRIPTMFKSVPNLVRSAIIHQNDHPTLLLQLVRLIKEGNFPDRKVFTSAEMMRGFLDPKLDTRESTRLATFLATP